MLYKHWKKILLSLTAFFWASCDNSTSADDDSTSSSSSTIETPKSSSATAAPESSSATEGPATSSETANPESSSSAAGEASSASEDNPNVTSSASVDKSSSSEMVAPKYGVPMSSSMIVAKYGVMMPTCKKIESKLTCDGGIFCTESETETMQSPPCDGDVCAKYGVVIVKESTYKCSDGKTYNEAEFRSKYQILDGAVDLYGCPSDICGPDTLIEENLPLYGVPSTVTRTNN